MKINKSSTPFNGVDINLVLLYMNIFCNIVNFSKNFHEGKRSILLAFLFIPYNDNVIKNVNSRLYALRLLKRAGLRQSDLVETYCLFIRSSVEYAAPARSNLTVNLSDLIENIQKCALRITYPGMSYDHALSHSSLEPLAR